MIEEKKSLTIKHLTYNQIRVLYELFFDRFKEIGEPIPSWSFVNKKHIEYLVDMPQSSFFGTERYKTIEEKASAIFYYINKGHIFPNGNKRFSVACMVTFLIINGYTFRVDPDTMTSKALEIAKSDPNDFENIKRSLAIWIRENLAD